MHFLPEKIDDYAVAHSQEEPIILKLSAKGMRMINKLGLSEALKRAKAEGHYNG